MPPPQKGEENRETPLQVTWTIPIEGKRQVAIKNVKKVSMAVVDLEDGAESRGEFEG